jgi:hypothetical protein
MCADCRVVDMMQSKNEVSVLSLGRRSMSAHAAAAPVTLHRPLASEEAARAISTRSSPRS